MQGGCDLLAGAIFYSHHETGVHTPWQNTLSRVYDSTIVCFFSSTITQSLSDEGSPVEIVNRTNNALESYNRRFNALFLKQPMLIEFAMIIEKESREQAQIRQDIVTGRKQEPRRKDIWIPTIPESYIQFKEEYYYLGNINPITTTITKKKRPCAKKAAGH
jgi:hypothetical protein